jgi:hypothetical protein
MKELLETVADTVGTDTLIAVVAMHNKLKTLIDEIPRSREDLRKLLRESSVVNRLDIILKARALSAAAARCPPWSPFAVPPLSAARHGLHSPCDARCAGW